jgi:hypothetical protein
VSTGIEGDEPINEEYRCKTSSPSEAERFPPSSQETHMFSHERYAGERRGIAKKTFHLAGSYQQSSISEGLLTLVTLMLSIASPSMMISTIFGSAQEFFTETSDYYQHKQNTKNRQQNQQQ